MERLRSGPNRAYNCSAAGHGVKVRTPPQVATLARTVPLSIGPILHLSNLNSCGVLSQVLICEHPESQRISHLHRQI